MKADLLYIVRPGFEPALAAERPHAVQVGPGLLRSSLSEPDVASAIVWHNPFPKLPSCGNSDEPVLPRAPSVKNPQEAAGRLGSTDAPREDTGSPNVNRKGPILRDPDHEEQSSPRVANEDLASLHAGNISPAIFERQRIAPAEFLPGAKLNPLSERDADRVLACLPSRDWVWTVQAFTSDPEAGKKLTARAAGFAQALLRQARKRYVKLFERYRETIRLERAVTVDVLQLCLAPDGLWFGSMPVCKMTSRRAGGCHRMKMDAVAPSRSYLKLEEVLDRMAVTPQSEESVIDLGAAPGGWSWSFLKRGCRVRAVDNGSMRLPDSDRLEHLRANGLTFTPQICDWLVADMLIPPGACLGVLRRWLETGMARRVIMNVKLPQQEVMAGLLPLLIYLRGQPGRWEVRQLFHDRREVTLWGQV